MYPRVIINPSKYKHNLNNLIAKLKPMGIQMMVVSKVFGADQHLIDIINHLDIDYISDSRIQNLHKMKTHHKKALLRLPSLSEISDVVKFADVSFNSNLKTICALNEEAFKQHKIHDIILMFDIGDLREGIYYQEDYIKIVDQILSHKNIHLKGIGTNITCYGGVIPTIDTMATFIDIKNKIENHFQIKLEIISGGNSSIYQMLMSKDFPKEINHLRIGELLILGKETAYGTPVEGMHDDVITIDAQIIEIGLKPSMPEGLLGMNAFGEKVVFKDEGIIKRAIVALGKQDVHPDHLICPKGITILGASSDHTIIKIDPELKLDIGDVIHFKLTYGGILSIMQSTYVRRVYDTLSSNMD
jgi:ornithine racemase